MLFETPYNNDFYKTPDPNIYDNKLRKQELIEYCEKLEYRLEQEKKMWNPESTQEYLIYTLVVYVVVVSIIFTTSALFQFASLTPDGTRFGYRVCIDAGYEMGREVCEAYESNPSYYRPAGGELFDILKRIGIVIGALWFPYMGYKWYKQRKGNENL